MMGMIYNNKVERDSVNRAKIADE